MRNKIVSAAEAAALVKDGDTLTTSGFVGIGVPDELLAAIEARFLQTGHPRDLSLVFAAGQGDGKERGLNRLGHEGLLEARHRWPLGAHPQGGGAGSRGKDRRVEPAARRDQRALPRHRRRQAGDALEGRAGDLRRSAQRRRRRQRHQHRAPGRTDGGEGRDLPLLPQPAAHGGASARHHGRRSRQHHHGARGADHRQPRAGHGGQECRRRGDRPGRARGPRPVAAGA